MTTAQVTEGMVAHLGGPLTIGGHDFTSRLIVGTGKYSTNQVMVEAIRASGAEMVTVAVRRVDLDRTKEEAILHHLDPDEFFLLANTAGCYNAEDAIRYARLARAAGFNEFVKLEVIGDETTLLPGRAGHPGGRPKTLADEGFKVMAYTNDDLITALRLEDAGCVAGDAVGEPDRERPGRGKSRTSFERSSVVSHCPGHRRRRVWARRRTRA